MVDQAGDVGSIRKPYSSFWGGSPFLGSAHTLAKGLISGTFGVASHGSCRARRGMFQGEKDNGRVEEGVPTALRALNSAVSFESFELV